MLLHIWLVVCYRGDFCVMRFREVWCWASLMALVVEPSSDLIPNILVSKSLSFCLFSLCSFFMARIDVPLDLDIKKFMNRMGIIHW